MEECEKILLELLRYVGYIKEEKVNVQCFLSDLLAFYRDKIHFNETKTLEETINKSKCLYDQDKGKAYFQKFWDDPFHTFHCSCIF